MATKKKKQMSLLRFLPRVHKAHAQKMSEGVVVLDFGSATTKHGVAKAPEGPSGVAQVPDEMSSVTFHMAGRLGCV